MNNAVYFEYFHQSRLEHLARLGIWHPRGFQEDNVFALAENTCRYLAPSFYGDVLSIWTATHAVGRTSFQFVYRVWRESDDALIAASHSVQVWLDGNNRTASLTLKLVVTEVFLKPGSKEWFMPMLREAYPHLNAGYNRRR